MYLLCILLDKLILILCLYNLNIIFLFFINIGNILEKSVIILFCLLIILEKLFLLSFVIILFVNI